MHQSRVAENPFDDSAQRAQGQTIIGGDQWRWWAIFRARVEVAFAEDHRGKPVYVVRIERTPPSESHFDARSRRDMLTVEACWQRCRVVGDHEIGCAEQLSQGSAGSVTDPAVRVDHQQLRVQGSL